VGNYSGESTIGNYSCFEYEACAGAGSFGGLSVIGSYSCSGVEACENVGGWVGDHTVGDGSCNGEGQCKQAYGVANTGTIGNCESNSVAVSYCLAGPITVTPASVSVTYGVAAPAYTFTAVGEEGAFSGWVKRPVCTSSYRPTTPVSASPVEVTCSGGDAGSRDILYIKGSVRVAKASLTVTPDAKTWTLGTPEPAYTYTVAGLKNGETVATATAFSAPVCGPLKGTPKEPGSYNLVCKNGSAEDYSFIYEGAVLTVLAGAATPTPEPEPTTGVPAPSATPSPSATSVPPTATPTRTAPSAPNTGSGTGGGNGAAWLLTFAALAMVAGGAAAWGRSRR
jgi:hypothetical protein